MMMKEDAQFTPVRVGDTAMRMWWMRAATAGLATLGLVSGSGCALAVDFFDPAFAEFLGLGGLRPTPGSVVVVWNNQTDFPARMAIAVSVDASDPSQGTSFQVSDTIESGASDNAVFDCPIGFIRPAGVAAGERSSDLAAAAATVFNVGGGDTGGTNVDVTFTGATLASGQDFICGDVIEVRLIQVADGGTDAATQFRLTVRRVPGR
jgi:hypothetical protein